MPGKPTIPITGACGELLPDSGGERNNFGILLRQCRQLPQPLAAQIVPILPKPIEPCRETERIGAAGAYLQVSVHIAQSLKNGSLRCIVEVLHVVVKKHSK